MEKKTRKTKAHIAAAAGMALTAGAANAVEIECYLVVDGCEGVGGVVWNDQNMDGLQDVGELGLAGATVNLLRASDLSQFASTTTDAAGMYEIWFSASNTGNYNVVVEFELLPGYTFSPQDTGADDTIDSDADIITGRTGQIHFSAPYNEYEFYDNVDAGMYLEAQIPLPAAIWLFGSGLFALAGIARHKKHA
jgi:hypothetical protein